MGELSLLAKDSQVDAKKRGDAIRSALKTIGKEDDEVQTAFYLAFYETLRRYNMVMTLSPEEAEIVEIPRWRSVPARAPRVRARRAATFVAHSATRGRRVLGCAALPRFPDGEQRR